MTSSIAYCVAVLITLTLTSSNTDAKCQSTGQDCLSSAQGNWACYGRRSGMYQACEGCTFYHVCANGILIPNMPCPLTSEGGIDGRLVWQQTASGDGQCLYTSTTCTECLDTTTISAAAAAAADDAVDAEVEGQAAAAEDDDDDVESGKRSDIFRRLMNELVEKRQQQQQQQEEEKEEVDVDRRHHKTCTTGPYCLHGHQHHQCSNLGDGDYQDCSSCTMYHTCIHGNIYAYRKCPAGLVWEQTTSNAGICQFSSTTCNLQCWKK